MCTYNGCYASFDEKERGSLEPGKLANMVILSDNPYTMPKEKLGTLKVEKLILRGQDYQSCVRPVGSAILSGLLSRSSAY